MGEQNDDDDDDDELDDKTVFRSSFTRLSQVRLVFDNVNL
jgi:hypothetical protein